MCQPPYIRLEQLKALIEAKVCNVGYANKPRVTSSNGKHILEATYKNKKVTTEVDFLVKARIPSLDFLQSTDPLICNLLKSY